MRRSFTRNDLLVRYGIVNAGIYGFIGFGIPLSHSLKEAEGGNVVTRRSDVELALFQQVDLVNGGCRPAPNDPAASERSVENL